MDENLKRLNESKYDETFDNTADWMINSQIKIKNKRSTIKMKDFLLRHKYQFAAVILLALLIGACNYPVTQNDTVGYVLSWSAPASSTKIVNESLNKLDWFKNSNITADVNNINGNETTEYKLVVQSLDEKLVVNYKNDLEKITQITAIKIVPINESVKRPVYSAALHSFFRIDVSTRKMSDEQVQAEIKKQLEDAGIKNANIIYTNDEKGRKKLQIKLSEDNSLKGGKMLEVNVDNKNGEQVVKLKTLKPDVDFSKMTDAEIRAYVKGKNEEDNLSDDDIKIIREGDNVKIQIEKEVEK